MRAVAPGHALPASRIQLGPQLTQPTIHQASIGYERPLGEWGNFRTDYMMTRATDTLRSVNVNAPINGVRPDPTAGNVTQIESTGRRASDRITVGMLAARPESPDHGQRDVSVRQQRELRRLAAGAAVEQQRPRRRLGSVGHGHPPSAVPDVQHAAAVRRARELQAQYSSAPPYTITTGTDDNGDTVFNDRPAGVGRNSARGASQWNVNLRLNRSFNLGGIARRWPGHDRRAAATTSAVSSAQRGPAAAPATAVRPCRWS